MRSFTGSNLVSYKPAIVPADESLATVQSFFVMLSDGRFLPADKLSPIINKLNKSQLYSSLKAKYNNTPANMTLEEVACLALGGAFEPDMIRAALIKFYNQNNAIKDMLSNPLNCIKLMSVLPDVYYDAIFNAYKVCKPFEALFAKAKDDVQSLSPDEFYVYLLLTLNSSNNLDIPENFGEITQYLFNPDKAFRFICYLPDNLLFSFLSGALINIKASLAASPTWLKHPKTTHEILVAAMLAIDVRAISAAALGRAIEEVQAVQGGEPQVARRLAGLRLTHAMIDGNLTPAAKWEAIRQATEQRLCFNLTQIDLSNSDLHGANLEFALLSPASEGNGMINMDYADLRNAKLPMCFGWERISLKDAQLDGSNILDYPCLTQAFNVNQSFFSSTTSGNVSNVLDALHAHLQLKLDENDMRARKYDLHEARNRAAHLLGEHIQSMPDDAEAQAIYTAAMAHRMFTHTKEVSTMFEKGLVTLFKGKLHYHANSQDILTECLASRNVLQLN